ncbi:InlB B-repeat-containing protein [Clostridium sp. BJN0001]|uniref:InlB B-repeat-containing protein n=1 Tax=Clostridium sp. BJN0001 TaxID=2930219 RepID=UPI001FD1C636|nr:InlB B-repeat-containing protein [Clostridium sp. BJN0001]
MKRNFISKLTALALLSSAITTAFPKGVSAEWMRNYNGTWNYIESGVSSIGWKYIGGRWYYFDKNRQMQTGVIQIEGKIYIFGEDGALLLNSAAIDGEFYNINSRGEVKGDNLPTPKRAFNALGENAVIIMPDHIMEDDDSRGPDVTPKKSDDEEESSLYSVTFKDDDGDKLRTSMVKYANELTLYTPYKSGYKFIEWNTDDDGDGTSYDAGDKIKIKSKKTLYAIWEKSTSDDDNKDEKIEIPVSSIEVTAADNKITTSKGTLQFTAKVLPVDATKSNVTWSVEDTTGHATIDSNGLLTAVNNGEVVVKATANDGSGEYGRMLVKITGQATSGTEPDNPDTPVTPKVSDVFLSRMSDASALNGKTYSVIRIIATDQNQDYVLDNVTADHIVINGGSSLKLNNCNIGDIEFYKSGVNTKDSKESPFTINSAASTVKQISVYNEEATIIGSGISKVNVSTKERVNIGDGSTITSIPEVNLNESSSKLIVNNSAQIAKVNVNLDAENSIITGDGIVSGIDAKATTNVYLKNSADNISGIINNKNEDGDVAINKQAAIDAVDKAENSSDTQFINEAVDAISKYIGSSYEIGNYTGNDDFVKALNDRLEIVKNGNSIDSNTSKALELINKLDSKISEAKTTYRNPECSELTQDADYSFSDGIVNETDGVTEPKRPEINFADLFNEAYKPIKNVEALNEKTYLELIAKLDAEKDKYDLIYNVYKFKDNTIDENATKEEVVEKLSAIGLKSTIENIPQEKIPGFLKRLNVQIDLLKPSEDFINEPIADKQQDINYAVNTSLTAEDAIETAKNDTESGINAVKALYRSDEKTLISGIDESRIASVKTYIDNALYSIDKSISLDESLNMTKPYEASKLLNDDSATNNDLNEYVQKYDDAALNYYTNEIKDGLFEDYDNEVLKSGIDISKIDDYKSLINNFRSNVYDISEITGYEYFADDQAKKLTDDYINKAKELLALKQKAIENLWNSINVTGALDATSEFSVKTVSANKQTYSIKITIPEISSFTYDNNATDPDKKGKLYLGSETPFYYNTALTEAYLKLNPLNAENIKIFARSGADKDWSEYSTYPSLRPMVINGDSSGKYEFSDDDGRKYSVIFKIGYSVSSSGRVYTIIMTPQ